MRILIFLFVIFMAISLMGNTTVIPPFTNQAVLAQPQNENDKDKTTGEQTSNDEKAESDVEPPNANPIPRRRTGSQSGSEPQSGSGSQTNKR